MLRRAWLWIMLVAAGTIVPGIVLAQWAGNQRSRTIPVQAGSIQLDTLSIVPGTIVLSRGDTSMIRVDYVQATLEWRAFPPWDSVVVRYRVFSEKLNRVYSGYRFDSITNFFRAAPAAVRTDPTETDKFKAITDFGNMQYTGSFGRSLSVGNTQDAVVNGVFNLQISGYLADSLEIAAAITDNNIPIQPDGTTQNLNEFDRIWMRFRKPEWEVNIGDIDLRRQPTYFMSYFKRQQGLSFSGRQKIGKNLLNELTTSGALAKGKFARNVFNGLEGNQGPYRLTGASNELFFVVLAGTERVFIDGKQVQRGEDQDYVINYNTAEITFTPKQLINKDLRIQVEFEYADRNYLNSLLYVENKTTWRNKAHLTVAWYSNTDAKNSSVNQTLNAAEKQFLNTIGDSINQAFFPSAEVVAFDSTRIQYIAIDSVVAGITYRIFRYQGFESAQMYNLNFAFIGEGKGNYIPAFNGANGKVYQWVAPVGGVPSGSYEPARFLVTPKRRAMLTVGGGWQISEHTNLAVSAGFSQQDLNLFSEKDQANDRGNGLRADLDDSRTINISKQAFTWKSHLGFESVGKDFVPLERLRTVEFLRDWGLPFDAGAALERIVRAGTGIAANDGTRLQYDLETYSRNNDYAGSRHRLAYADEWKGWRLNSLFQTTLFADAVRKGQFLRPFVQLDKVFTQWKSIAAGASFQLEHNAVETKAGGQLSPISFSFSDWRAYLRSNEQQRNRWSLEWFSRANRLPLPEGFVPQDVQHTFSLRTELLASKQHTLRLQASYRALQVKTPGLTNQQNENTLLGRVEYQWLAMKGALRASVFYETGAGQEQQRDFSYVEVQAGRGEFAWIDYNGDGIAQLNEFEQAIFPDQAKYIRIFTPTNRFVRATYNTFNYSVVFNPRSIWLREKKGWKALLAKVNAQSSLQTNRKQINDGSFQLNPFAGSVADENLISMFTNVANNLSFNRFSTSWGIDLGQVRNITKAILTYGFETRITDAWSLKWRKNIGRQFTVNLQGRYSTQELTTPNPKFENRNYFIKQYQVEPGLAFTNGSVFRADIGYRFVQKNGTTPVEQPNATWHSIQSEAKWNAVQKSVLTGKLQFTQIAYEGPVNSTVSYIMLEALQPGRNLLWSLDFTRRISNTFELGFQYEGRQAGSTRTVHIGRASLRAIL